MIVPTGRLLLSIGCTAIPALLVVLVFPEFTSTVVGFFIAFAAAAAIDAYYGRKRTREIEVRVPPSVRWVKDSPARLDVELVNKGPAARRLRIAAAFPIEVACSDRVQQIEAGADALTVTWHCLPGERGSFRLAAIEWEQRSRAGLWSVRTRLRPDCELRVYPNLRNPQTRALLLRRNMESLRLTRQIGKGREFERLREYAPGDAYDEISWKATARRARPVISVTRLERMQQVYVAIDTSRLAARPGALDAYVDASLHLAIACQRQGDQFGLLTFNDRIRRFVRAGSGARHFGILRDALYSLQASRVAPDFNEAFTFIQRMLRRRALIVVLTFLEDAALAEDFVRDAAIVSRRHVVVVHAAPADELRPAFSGPPPETEHALYERLAGQVLSSRLQETARSLERLGAGFHLLNRHLMHSQIVGSYLDLKRRQAI